MSTKEHGFPEPHAGVLGYANLTHALQLVRSGARGWPHGLPGAGSGAFLHRHISSTFRSALDTPSQGNQEMSVLNSSLLRVTYHRTPKPKNELSNFRRQFPKLQGAWPALPGSYCLEGFLLCSCGRNDH